MNPVLDSLKTRLKLLLVLLSLMIESPIQIWEFSVGMYLHASFVYSILKLLQHMGAVAFFVLQVSRSYSLWGTDTLGNLTTWWKLVWISSRLTIHIGLSYNRPRLWFIPFVQTLVKLLDVLR